MGQMVVKGATAMCTFGAAPAVVNATSQMTVQAGGLSTGTIQDCQPTNLFFGMCTSPTNPAVAAAMGSPMPCTLQPAGTWIPVKPMVLVNGKPCLTSDCKLTCAYGGFISITMPGQVKTMV